MKRIFILSALAVLFCIPSKGDTKNGQKTVFQSIVAQDGSGTHSRIQEAIDAVPDNQEKPWLIFIKNGDYREKIVIPATKPFIHLIGQDKHKTIIHHNLNVGGKPKTGDEAYWAHSVHNPDAEVYALEGAVVHVKSTDFYAENISFLNDWGVKSQAGPQALALKCMADRHAFKNCIFRSYQDTWQTSSKDEDRIYARDCFIEGAVDYFYGGGDALVENSTLYNVRAASVIVAPCHKNAAFGYVFRHCTIDGNNAAAKGVKLGRPWHNAPRAVYIHSTMKVPVDPEGWTNMGTVPALFAEYDSRDAQGNLLDLSLRKTTYEGRGADPVKGSCPATVTKEEADKMVYQNIILRSDKKWDPRHMMTAPAAPKKVTMKKSKLTWKAVKGAIGYLVFDGENVLGMTTKPSFVLPATTGASIQVCAVGQYGALGPKKEVNK